MDFLGEGFTRRVTVESEVRLIYFDTSSKMLARQIPTGQGRLTFGVAPESATADAAGATVDEDDQDDEVVLVAEQEKQQKERTQPVLNSLQRRGRRTLALGRHHVCSRAP